MSLLQKQLAWLRSVSRRKLGNRDVLGIISGAGLVGAQPKGGRVIGVNGTSDLYTVPPGKVAVGVAWFRNNPTGGPITTGLNIITGANSIRVNASPAAIGAGVANNISMAIGTLMSAGDILRVTDDAAGLAHTWSVVEGPADLNSFFKLARSFEITTVAEKIYEAPAGKIGILTTTPIGGSNALTFFNNSGTGAKTCSLYLVPPGQSVAAEYLIGTTSPADNGNGGAVSGVPHIPTGYSLWVTSSSNDAGVKCRALIAEYDA